MYSTTKQIHVAIDILYQQLASNRKRSYHPEEIDHIYNMSMLKFISNRSNPKTNIKHEGRETTVKRVEDLRELKARKTLPAFIDSPKLQYAILPSNYREFKDGECKVVYNCRGLGALEEEVLIKSKVVIPFLDSNAISNLFADFKIELLLSSGISETLFDINNYVDFVGFHSNSVKFEIINLLLDSVLLSKKDVEIYWESYGSDYEQSCFIIIAPADTYNSATISFDGVSNTISFVDVSYDKYKTSGLVKVDSFTSSCDLVPSEHISEILQNSMMNKNRQESPLIELEDNMILIHHDNKFVVDSILLRYDKKPIFMNFKANILPSLLDRADEIIKMVVATMAITTSGSIEGLLQESQINE